FLVASLTGFERAGHLAGLPLPGGAAAIRQPWRMAAAYLDAAYPGGMPAGLDVAQRNERRWDNVVSMARRGINSPVTSSAGRLFDAAATILGVRDLISYEGQAAIELEQLADPAETRAYPASIVPAAGPGPFQVTGADLIRAVADDLGAGTSPAIIAARFHHGVASMIVAAAELLRDQHGLGTVALSGGVFQNLLLLAAAVSGLETAGFRVLTHSQVPCNDGGISFGQAAVAAAVDNPVPA
ncbi:MAG: carbamoyltransferase HypF, partial [Actinomycetota bacterium]